MYSWDELKPQGDIGKPGKKKNQFYTCELKSGRIGRIEEKHSKLGESSGRVWQGLIKIS